MAKLLILEFSSARAGPSHLGQLTVEAVGGVDFHEIVDQAWFLGKKITYRNSQHVDPARLLLVYQEIGL